MAVFTDAQITVDVLEEDQILIRQGLTDKRIVFNLAETLAWGARKESVYLGEHLLSSTYDSLDSFRTYNNLPFFPKVGVSLPYTATVSNPTLDSNLTNISYTDYKDIINVSQDVGSTLLRFDDIHPETKYPWQTWELVDGDASIRLGDGTAQSQTPSGENEPLVPLVEHEHIAGARTKSDDTGVFLYGNTSVSQNGVFMSVGTSSHSGTRAGYTSTEGEAGATLDVRGKSIKINLWVRIA